MLFFEALDFTGWDILKEHVLCLAFPAKTKSIWDVNSRVIGQEVLDWKKLHSTCLLCGFVAVELDFDAPYIIVVDYVHAPTKPNTFSLDSIIEKKQKHSFLLKKPMFFFQP